MTADFASKVAVIAGGSSGIGQVTAEPLAERGARVAVIGPETEAAKSVVDGIVAAGNEAIALAADVWEESQVANAFSAIAGEFGGVDVLVCSAGVQRYGTVTETDPEVRDEVFEINVRGAFFSARAALPFIRTSEHGAVVLVSSVQAFATQRDVAAYTASKGALNALVRSMAVDEAVDGVRVNAVCPGSVDTPMLRASAEVIAFLAGQHASFVTGESVRVDGGLAVQLTAQLPNIDLP